MRNLLSLICVLAVSGAALAQTPASWGNLSVLRAGQDIQVVEVTSKKHLGSFVNVSDTAISFRETAGDRTLQKQDVRSVRLRKGSRRLRHTLIGAAIGAGAGAGIGAGAWESSGFLGGKGAGAAVGAVIGLAGGAVVGALLPSHETIYSAAPR